MTYIQCMHACVCVWCMSTLCVSVCTCTHTHTHFMLIKSNGITDCALLCLHQAIIMVPPNHPKNQQHPWCGGPTPQQLGFLAVSPGSLHRGNELRVDQNCPWTLLRMSMCSHSPEKSHWSVPTVPPTLALCPPTGKWPSRKMATPTSSSEYILSFSA